MKDGHANSVQFAGIAFDLEEQECDFCGGPEFRPFWSAMRRGWNLPTVLCATCGLCQTRSKRFDIPNFIQRMKMLERVYALARVLPNVGPLGKIRSTLRAS